MVSASVNPKNKNFCSFLFITKSAYFHLFCSKNTSYWPSFSQAETMRTSFFSRQIGVLGVFLSTQVTQAESLPVVQDVDFQPLKSQIQRLIQAKDYLGEPFSADVKKQLIQAFAQADATEAIAEIQDILDAQCLVDVQINPESRVKVNAGPVKQIG